MKSESDEWKELIGDTFYFYEEKVEKDSIPISKTKENMEPILKVPFIGLYFAASWCPPCQNFTPKLITAYKEVNKNGKIIEIVLITADHKPEDFQKYRIESGMPWIAIPFEREDKREDLSVKYKVDGIPTLVILNSKRDLLCNDATEDIGDIGVEGLRKYLK